MLNSIRVVMLMVCVGSWGFGCSKDAADSQGADASHASTPVTVDGNAAEWEGCTPLIQEAGLPGRGDFDDVDIKQVYVRTDTNNLYLFARCNPSIQDFFAEKPVSQGLFAVFINASGQLDNAAGKDADTIDGLPGYDCKISFVLGMFLDLTTQKGHPSIDIDVSIRNNETWSPDSWKANSDDQKAAVAFGKDGVEACIPLSAIGITPGAKVGVLFCEDAHFADNDAINKAEFSTAGE